MPFRDGCFEAVIANHSLEHFTDLEGALKEVGRVVKAKGALYASVPDAATLTDILYRWISSGGGHANAFKDPQQVVELVEKLTKLPCAGSRTLLSSLSFLNPKNRLGRTPIKLRILGGGSEHSLRAYVFISRLLDRVFGTRFSVYGWAFYFGTIGSPIETGTWGNVCVGCGSGVPFEQLRSSGSIRRRFLVPDQYRCPVCGTRNLLVADSWSSFA